MKFSKADFRKMLAAFLALFTCGYFVILTLCEIPEKNLANANMILGFLSASALGAIIGFYFGASETTDTDDANNTENNK